VLKPRDAVRYLKEYHPPLGGRQGLRLDFNENTVGCSPRVLQRLQSLSGEELARYPEREPGEKIVAAHLGIDPAEVILTNGTDEAIHLVCETFLEPEHEAIVAVPTFAMYEIYSGSTGARVISVQADDSFKFPTEGILSQINSHTRLIAMANPNNPTGALASAEDLIRLAKAAPDAALLVDEAYFEFAGETLMPRWRGVPNLFVSRTFSKAYGLAGLRIGVLTGHVDQMTMVRRNSSPYNLNIAALVCLPEALADQAFIRSYVEQALAGRVALENDLRNRGIKYWPSRANFVLMYLGAANKPFISAMRERGILVRDRSNDPGCKDCVRITVGAAEHNARLMATLPEVFEQIGLQEKVAK
jgi:histidinol-phosphate aminotransferase